ncbi:MAG: TlyA family RNA methyltransferase [Oscillospiraceae bacterium]
MRGDRAVTRADVLLAARGFAPSRAKAQELIKSGAVRVGERLVTKPSEELPTDAAITVEQNAALRYVGRGGLKLEKALSVFGISVAGKTCADIGASTGGFTDCLLQNGAGLVYAVDVGHDQLDARLRGDCRVVNREGVNAKALTPALFEKAPQFLCADLSFISVTKVFAPMKAVLAAGGEAVVLVKPQFEAGRTQLNRQGVVRSPNAHKAVLVAALEAAQAAGFVPAGLDYSPVTGGDGNIEYLLYLKTSGNCPLTDPVACVARAHQALKERGSRDYLHLPESEKR